MKTALASLGLIYFLVACAHKPIVGRTISNQESAEDSSVEEIYYFPPQQTTMVVQGKEIQFALGRTSYEYVSGNSTCEFVTLSPVDPHRGFTIPAHTAAVLYNAEVVTSHRDGKSKNFEPNILYYFRAPGTNIISFTLRCFVTNNTVISRMSPGDIQIFLAPLATIASSAGLLKMNVNERRPRP